MELQPGPPFSQMVTSSTGSPMVGWKTKNSCRESSPSLIGTRPEYISPRSNLTSGRLLTRYSASVISLILCGRQSLRHSPLVLELKKRKSCLERIALACVASTTRFARSRGARTRLPRRPNFAASTVSTPIDRARRPEVRTDFSNILSRGTVKEGRKEERREKSAQGHLIFQKAPAVRNESGLNIYGVMNQGTRHG